MMITDGGSDWYLAGGNYTGIGWLGVTYRTGNGKTFDRYAGGITNEFAIGQNTTKWVICHEYGHYIGLGHRGTNYGAYSLMYWEKLNEGDEGAMPLSILEIAGLGWLDLNNSNRVQTVSSGALTNFSLKPIRSTSGKVAIKVNISSNQYFLINNHQQSTNPYDATYPASGVLIWHINGSSGDLECAVPRSGENQDHLDLPKSDPNYHGEGLAGDFWRPSSQNTFAPWTNPNTKSWTGNFTDIKVKVKSQSGGDYVLDVFKNSEPAAPKNLVITNPGSDGSHPILQWNANTEPDLHHYLVWRGTTPNWKTTPITWESSSAANVTNTTWTDTQTIIDLDVLSATYYRITAVDAVSNQSDYSSSVGTTSNPLAKPAEEEPHAASLPENFSLHTNFPNPFNPSTEIKFDLPEPAQVNLTIFNIAGQMVRTLVDEPRLAGYHSILWDGRDEFGNEVASGMYLYRISATTTATASPYVAVKKMSLLR